MKNVAIVGSSGGNLFSLGGSDPNKLLSEIIVQSSSAGINISDILFIGASASMDNVKDNAEANIYTYSNSEIVKGDRKKLLDINSDAKEEDVLLANKIRDGLIDGLILVSCDPEKVNEKSIGEAIKKKIPIVGTGGTSMANLQSKGANVIALSGTVGTTNRTRAIASITSLSNHFHIKYKPVIGGGYSDNASTGNILSRINLRGIMISALPGFISIALILAISKISIFSSLDGVFKILIATLPVMLAVIAAKQVSGLDDIGIISGIIAGVLSVNGGIIGGIAGGILAGIFSSFIIKKCFDFKFPATTANIIAGGLSGLAAGLLVYYFLAPIALFIGDGIKNIIESMINFSPILAGGIAGLLIWPAIIGGVYHAAILPIVLLEMESTGLSFLGAIDMVGLVMVSAGIMAANIVFPKRKEDKSIACPGFLINIGFGTFVEASYPFMFSNKLVFGTAIISSGLAGIFVGIFNLKGTAYVPSIVAPSLSNSPIHFVIAMLIGFGSAFILTSIINKFSK